MAGFQHLAKDYSQGNRADLVLVNRTTKAETMPGSCLSDTLYLKREAQGFHANADGTVVIEPPPRSTDPLGTAVPGTTFVVKAGVYYPVRVGKVKATGTTLGAADIVLYYLPY